MKKCIKCGVEKPLTEFNKRTDTGRYRNDCKQCRGKENLKRYHTKKTTKEAHSRASLKHYLKKRYDLTVEQYEQMLEDQNHRCAICREPETQGRRLAVDHDHSTGKVRSLLCQSCNTAIGKLKDDPELIRRAAEYVEHHSSERARDATSSIRHRDQRSLTPA